MNLMKAARLYGPDDVRLERVPCPSAGQGEVLIRVAAAGVCGSDAAEWRHGPIMTRPMKPTHSVTGRSLPVVLGHEFAGEIVSVGDGVPRSRLGQLVSCGAGVSCGRCRHCTSGRTNLCERYYTLGYHADGGLAEYVAVPSAIAITAPDGLTPDAAALGQPMAIAVHAYRRARLGEGARIVVIGIGGIGAFIVAAATHLGAEVLAIDIAPDRLDLASELGAADSALASDAAPVGDLLSERGWMPDAIFEVSGSSSVLEQVLSAPTRGSRVVAVGLQKHSVPVSFADVAFREADISGTIAHVCAEDLPLAMTVLAGRVQGWGVVAPTVSPLTALVSGGLEPLADGSATVVKSLFDPGAETARAAAY